MGDAKRRGSLEERKMVAIARQKAEKEHKAAMIEMKTNQTTPEQEAKTLKARMAWLTLMGVCWPYNINAMLKK